MLSSNIISFLLICQYAHSSHISSTTNETGSPCVSRCRFWKNGQDLYCHYESNGLQWGPCEDKDEGVSLGLLSMYGLQCRSRCSYNLFKNANICQIGYSIRQRENSYRTWDYCSRYKGFDYRNRKCSSSCDFHHGSSIKFCYLEDGDSGFC